MGCVDVERPVMLVLTTAIRRHYTRRLPTLETVDRSQDVCRTTMPAPPGFNLFSRLDGCLTPPTLGGPPCLAPLRCQRMEK